MKKRNRFFMLIPGLILWLMLGVLLWGSVFVRITDAPRENKITLYIDAAVPGDTALSVTLEAAGAEGIRMVQARPFSYAMFDGGPLKTADLLIVPASHVETYKDWLSPLPEEMRTLGTFLEIDGEPWGLLVYDHETGSGFASSYIQYEPAENYYLFFGSASVHREDGKAVLYALKFLEL